MSKLIKGMISELLINKGKDIDKVILENIDSITSIDPRLLQVNGLTSLFMLDVDKNPKEAFLKNCDEQEGYDKKEKREHILEDALQLAKDFDDKDFKKSHKQSSTIQKFIDAIEANQGGFKNKYGNTLFLNALKQVSKKAPEEHFAVQILSAITRAKLQAKSEQDIEKLNEIETSCKPLVYAALKAKNPFKKQMEIQSAVLKTFENESNQYEAYEYFRNLSIHNIIKTKLASESQLNTNVNETNANNSLFYIDGVGTQRFLINPGDPDVKPSEMYIDDSGIIYRDGKITDIIKKCALFDNGNLTLNSKYIQKALLMINDRVNDYNRQTQRSQKSIQRKENFIQSAIAFLILLDVENVKDDFDLIGLSIANPLSDIVAMMRGNSKELDTLIMNGYKIASRIVRAELKESLNDRYFKQITAGEHTEEKTDDAQDDKGDKTPIQPSDTEQPSQDSDTDSKPKTSKQTKAPKVSVKTPQTKQPKSITTKKATSYVRANIKFYKTITKKLISVLSKDQAVLQDLETRRDVYEEAKKQKQKAKNLSKTQQAKLSALQTRYGSSAELAETIDELKAMNSDMDFLSSKMATSISKDQELSIDGDKQSMFLSESQYDKNATRIESYIEYYKFIKAFDNERKITMADIYAYRETHKNSVLAKLFDLLPPQMPKQVVSQAQTSQTAPSVQADTENEEEQSPDAPEQHN